MFEIYVYGTIGDYTRRHPHRPEALHDSIDAFYVQPNGNLILALSTLTPLRRPALDMGISTMAMADCKRYTTLTDTKIRYNDTWYEPDKQLIGFGRHWWPWPRRYLTTRRISRFIGRRPKRFTKCRYNWYFNSEQKRIAFVLSP